MESQVEFIRQPNLAASAQPTAGEALVEALTTHAIANDVSPNDQAHNKLGFDFGTLHIRKRALNAERKGLIEKSELKAIINETPEGSVDGLLAELVINKNNFLPVCFLEEGARQARAVCKITTFGTDYKGHQGSWSGTGVLVGENILLTNYHVLNSLESARNATCIFNYQVDGKKQLQATREFTLNPARLFISSPVIVEDPQSGTRKMGLDYAFVWINGEPAKDYGFISLNRSAFNILEGENANIIQHPNGQPKIVALQDNTVEAQDLLVVHYLTDTDPGSSGALVLNNEWKPIALHHASRQVQNPFSGQPRYINEGIKLSAIAAHIEQRSQQPEYAKSATEVLKLFRDVDTNLGFFGGLGRNVDPDTIGVEKVVDTYSGEDDDIDVGFWNIEWFNKRFEDKLEKVAEVIANMNLDIWGFSEASLEATEELVKLLKKKYRLHYACLGSEPDASGAKQTNTVLWNTKTLTVEKIDWPEEVQHWFQADSRDFDDLGLGLESVDGAIFPRVAQPYLVTARGRGNGKEPFAFNFLPLHLKAMDEGSLRRRMASRIIGAAIERMRESEEYDHDWIIGGDVNAPLATQDFKALLPDMTAISAADEEDGAFSYLKRPKSLIDHIFLSREMTRTYGRNHFFVVAAEKGIPNYVKEVSDHRPVLVRLSLHAHEQEERHVEKTSLEALAKTLKEKFPTRTDVSEMPKELYS